MMDDVDDDDDDDDLLHCSTSNDCFFRPTSATQRVAPSTDYSTRDTMPSDQHAEKERYRAHVRRPEKGRNATTVQTPLWKRAIAHSSSSDSDSDSHESEQSLYFAICF